MRRPANELVWAAAAVLTAIGASALLFGGALGSLLSWAWWGSTIGLAVGGTALIVHFVRRGDPLSILPLLTGFWLLAFLAGGLFYRVPREDSVLSGISRTYLPDDMKVAMLLGFLGWICIVAGWYSAGRLTSPVARVPKPPVTVQNFAAVALSLWALALVARFFTVQMGFYFHFEADGAAAASSTTRQVVTIAASFGLVATALAGAAYYRGQLHRAWYYLAVVGEIAWALPSGERFRLIQIAVLLVVVRYYASERAFPTRQAVIAGALAVFVVFPAGAIYRGADVASRGASDYQADPGENIRRTASTLVGQSPLATAQQGIEEALRRFSGPTSVAAIVGQGREKYPTDAGEAVNTWAGTVAPRALLPSKADPSLVANEFGRRYSVFSRYVRNSSVAMTTVGDLFGTFGLAGLVIGMTLIGALMRALEHFFADRRTNLVSLALYAALIGGLLLGFEGTVAMGLIQNMRELLVYLIVITGLAVVTRVAPTRRRSAPVRDGRRAVAAR